MHRPVLLVVAVAALGLAGCTDQTAGTATAGGEPTSEQTTESTGETAEPDGGESPLADVEPCSLLSAQDATTAGLTGGEEGSTGGARDCRYQYEGPTIDDLYTVGVAIFDELGIEDVVGTGVQPVPTIGDHDAVIYTPPAGGCAVSIKTSESSRVDTLAVGGAEERACSIVVQVATLVEPELP